MQKNTTSLENRIRNAKKFKFTDQLAVRKVLENVVKIPFADFMFLYPRIYQDVMADMQTSFRKGSCPNYTTGRVCTFVSKQYACYPNDRATRQLIDEMEKPYSAVNSFLDKEPIRADVKNSEATWNYVKEKMNFRSFINNGIIASIASLVIYFANIPMPDIFYSCDVHDHTFKP